MTLVCVGDKSKLHISANFCLQQLDTTGGGKSSS